MQHDIENDSIIKDQMANLGCVLLCVFCNFLAHVSVAEHTTYNLDLGEEQSFENEGYEIYEKGRHQKSFSLRILYHGLRYKYFGKSYGLCELFVKT